MSLTTRLPIPQLVSSGGMGLFFTHEPFANEKKSFAGLTVVSALELMMSLGVFCFADVFCLQEGNNERSNSAEMCKIFIIEFHFEE
jgi:hypothetical protein